MIKKLFRKNFFKLMNNVVFRKAMENVRDHRDIKFITTEERSNYLVSEPNYYTSAPRVGYAAATQSDQIVPLNRKPHQDLICNRTITKSCSFYEKNIFDFTLTFRGTILFLHPLILSV